jgi:formamidopyrimidine-DNA glycosylase
LPELPEVETVRRQLAGSVSGLRFTRVERVEPSMLLDCTVEKLREELPGRSILEVGRVGKFIVLGLSGDAFVTIHLGMTGHILVRTNGPDVRADALDPHSRFLFLLEQVAIEPGERNESSGTSTSLEFRDMRKFGRLHLTFGAPPKRLASLGPDAWKGQWGADYLSARLSGRKAPLKALLLDQRILAGIGNIYVDEILWEARLSPVRRAGSLTPEELVCLAGEIPRRLEKGVRLLGCSISDFVDTDGRPGTFQQTLQAYGRHGQTCRRCGQTLVRIVVAGRGTAYCPGCQF